MRALHHLAVAVRFLTRLPIPETGLVEARDLAPAAAFFPWVGCAVGLATGLVLEGSALVWSVGVAVLVALAFEALLTGALHEDAVADFFDAFGGGWSREDVLRILKDSRLGTYGALALVLLVGLRAVAMVEVSLAVLPLTLPAFAVAAGLGRLLAVALMASLDPVAGRDGLGTDVGSAVGASQLLIGSLGVLPCLLWLAALRPLHTLLLLPASALLFLTFRTYLRRRLGGTTGDCLGCLSFLGQLVALLVVGLDLDGLERIADLFIGPGP